jgi:DNA replication protein DnaC
MNLIELNRSLVQLRLSGMAAVMETRLLQAQSENMAPIDLISTLVSDELACRSKRLLERRHKQAQFRDADKRLDNFDFQFNARMNRNLVFDLGHSELDRKARRCPVSWSTWQRQEPLRPSHRTRCHPAGLPCVVS